MNPEWKSAYIRRKNGACGLSVGRWAAHGCERRLPIGANRVPCQHVCTRTSTFTRTGTGGVTFTTTFTGTCTGEARAPAKDVHRRDTFGLPVHVADSLTLLALPTQFPDEEKQTAAASYGRCRSETNTSPRSPYPIPPISEIRLRPRLRDEERKRRWDGWSCARARRMYLACPPKR
jgi:hypothetical protein